MDMFRAAFADWNIIIWYFTDKKTIAFPVSQRELDSGGFQEINGFLFVHSKGTCFSLNLRMRYEVACTAIIEIAALPTAGAEYREKRHGKLCGIFLTNGGNADILLHVSIARRSHPLLTLQGSRY